MTRLITITELSKELNLISKKNGKPLNHTLRYWEKKFKQINPKIINKRRYYSFKQVELFKLIKFLLKDRGMTVNGVKNVLKSNINKLDDYNSHGLKADYLKISIKNRSKTILNKLIKIKKYGKKNTH